MYKLNIHLRALTQVQNHAKIPKPISRKISVTNPYYSSM